MVEAGRIRGDAQRRHAARRAPPAPPWHRPWRPSHPRRATGSAQCRGVVPGAQRRRRPARWPVRRSDRDRRRRSRTAPRREAARGVARGGQQPGVATGVGRIWSRSAAIGLSSRSASGVSPNSAAVARSMKPKVTHSSMPARRQHPARQRGARLLRRERGQRHRRRRRGSDTGRHLHRGRGGAAPPPPGRIPARPRRSPRPRRARGRGRQARALVQRRPRRRDVVAPGRHGDGHAAPRRAPARRSRAARSDAHRLIRRHVGAAKPGDALEAQRRVALPGGLGAGRDHLARLAAAAARSIIARGGLQRRRHQRRVDAALEALPRIGADVVAPAGQRDAHRIEQRAFDEDARWWPRRSRNARRRSRRPAPRAPPSSAMTPSSVGQRVVLAVQRAPGSRPRAPCRMVSVVASDLRTSKTCSGRPRSKVKKLVTSTSALIGRRPIAISRSCSHFGLGPLRHARASRGRAPRCRRAGRSICQRSGAAKAAGTGRRRAGLQRAEAGGREVARTPRTDERVAAVRRDADLDHRIVEAGPGDVAARRPAHPSGRSTMPAWSSPRPISRAESIIASDFTPRISPDLQGDAGAGDEGAGQRRARPSCRCAHWARRRRRRAAPVAGIDLAARAGGRRSGAAPPRCTWAMRKAASAAPRSSTPSTSRPMAESVVVIARACASVVEVLAQPGQGELHRRHDPPSCSDGGASGSAP